MIRAIIFDFNRTLYDPTDNLLIEGSLDVLNRLSSHKRLALITTRVIGRQDVIKDLGIMHFFNAIIFTFNKSTKDFMDCCIGLDVSPEEVIVVGDRISEEILIGNQLGMYTVFFSKSTVSQSSSRSERPKRRINSLKKLIGIVEELG